MIVLYIRFMMSQTQLTRFIDSESALMEHLKEGKNEANMMNGRRKSRLARSPARELPALWRLSAAVKGAEIRRNWAKYESVIRLCNTEE